jgi:hypothetical protein
MGQDDAESVFQTWHAISIEEFWIHSGGFIGNIRFKRIDRRKHNTKKNARQDSGI